MAYDGKTRSRIYMREYMRQYRRNRQTWYRDYQREYHRQRRAGERAERDAEIARLLEIDERERRIANGTPTMDDLQAMLDEVKIKLGVKQTMNGQFPSRQMTAI
jgi:hypothetical protein